MSKKTNNITPKILALLFAVFLWSYVMGIENPEVSRDVRNVDVVFQNTSELERRGLVVMEPKEFKVSVRVTGKKSEVDKFFRNYSKNIVAQVDLSGYGEGEHKVGITASIEDTSANVRITSIEPREMLVNLDKIITKEKPINVVTEGEVGGAHVLDSIQAKPQTILISGPRSWVNEVAEVRVLANISERTSSTSLNLPIQLLDDQGEEVRGVDKDPGLAEVEINILRKRTVPIRLETKGKLPDNYKLSQLKLSPDQVTIKGDQRIDEIDYINTKPLDIASLTNNEIKEVELDLPEGIELVNPNEKISINYDIEEIMERDFKLGFNELEIRNLADDLELEAREEDFLFKFKGVRNILADLSKDDIKAYLDLKDRGAGNHQINIQIETIEGLSLESVSPSRIEVSLSSKEEDQEEE